MKQFLRWLFHYAYQPADLSLRAELRSINESLWSIGQAEATNYVLDKETRLRLNRIQRELQKIAAGRLRFDATETWRTCQGKKAWTSIFCYSNIISTSIEF